jgi:TRAP-type uncharacterized transport system fused permease subunit
LALGGGVGLGLAANGKRASAEAAPSAGLAQSELGTARAFATGANVAYGVGAAVAAAGIVWGVWNLVRRPPATGLTVVVGPGSIGAGVTF